MTEPAAGVPMTVDTLVQQLLDLGVEPGGVLLVHTSFRAIRPVEGGPAGVVEALTRALGPEGTLVMPSWPDDGLTPFDPATTDPAADLGVVARTFWRLPGTERSRHIQAFAARGPRAGEILGDPLPLPPHIPASPVGRVRDLDGQVLLLGVDHDASTTIHLAELEAEVPYGIPARCVAEVDGEHRVLEYRENDHCCALFRLVGEWLQEAGEEREGPVGHGTARLARSRTIVDTVRARLEFDPLVFLHMPGECAECDEALKSIRPGPPVVQHQESGGKGAFFVESEGRRVAAMTYTRAGVSLVIIDHTEVDPSLKGEGVGRRLLEALVEWVRRVDLRVVALCPFAAAQFSRDPALRDVLN